MKKLRKILPFLIANAIAFYVFPLFIKDTGTAMLVLLIGIPTICFIVSLIYGIKETFDWFYILLTMLIFIPSIFIFYNESAAIYTLVYGIISTVGNFLGGLISKISKKIGI